jgi:hypothetical protein
MILTIKVICPTDVQLKPSKYPGGIAILYGSVEFMRQGGERTGLCNYYGDRSEFSNWIALAGPGALLCVAVVNLLKPSEAALACFSERSQTS